MTRPRAIHTLALLAVVAAIGLIGHACADRDETLAPERLRPSFQASGGADQFTLPTPGTNEEPTPWTNTGWTLPPEQAVRFTAAGFLFLIPNPEYERAFGTPEPHPAVGPAGVTGPGAGFNVLGFRVHARIIRPNGDTVPVHFTPNEMSEPATMGIGQGPGVVQVGRPKAIGGSATCVGDPLTPGACRCWPGNSCFYTAVKWIVAGEQTLAREDLPPAEVTADRERVEPGDTVRFEVSIPWTDEFGVLSPNDAWRWVPEPAVPPASRLVQGCGNQRTCAVVVRERGYVEVGVTGPAGVFYRARSPVVDVRDRELEVHLTAQPEAVTPEIPGFRFTPCTTAFPRVPGGTAQVKAEARYDDGEPAAGAEITLTTRFVPRSGGHDHQAEERAGFGTLRPAAGGVGLTTLVGEADAGGLFAAVFEAGVVGGEERILARAFDGEQEAETDANVEVALPGLETLGEGTGYVLVGNTGTVGGRHTSNHWGLPTINHMLRAIAESLHVHPRLPNRKFLYNDMSLEGGGRFDLGPDFRYGPDGSLRGADFEPPHITHNRGSDIDVDDDFAGGGKVPFGLLSRLVRGRVTDAIVIAEGNHYHVRFQRCPTN